MVVTIQTKDVGEVRNKFRKECKVSNDHEHEQDYIKKELGVQDTQGRYN